LFNKNASVRVVLTSKHINIRSWKGKEEEEEEEEGGRITKSLTLARIFSTKPLTFSPAFSRK
jgi:hypothetical protein